MKKRSGNQSRSGSKDTLTRDSRQTGQSEERLLELLKKCNPATHDF